MSLRFTSETTHMFSACCPWGLRFSGLLRSVCR